MKLTDPGPKMMENWNFAYDDVSNEKVMEKIIDIGNRESKNGKKVVVYYKILNNNEISDEELMKQVADRSRYMSFLTQDNILLRFLHCHYNFEKCGEFIVEKEKELNIEFDNFIYIRPDLYFTEPCGHISNYSGEITTLGTGPNWFNNDYIAIIPRRHFWNFFFGRMYVVRTNKEKYFDSPEVVYKYTIYPFDVKDIGQNHIKRQKVL